mmetsp:Transcript_32158/g.88183  ORF Transcript_32158/g.88183 Transcript_32158/m.88183 type:complete len:85 (-) Transcript_32158:1968-2222(-)
MRLGSPSGHPAHTTGVGRGILTRFNRTVRRNADSVPFTLLLHVMDHSIQADDCIKLRENAGVPRNGAPLYDGIIRMLHKSPRAA